MKIGFIGLGNVGGIIIIVGVILIVFTKNKKDEVKK